MSMKSSLMPRPIKHVLLLACLLPAASRFEEDLREADFAANVGHDSAALILFTKSGPNCLQCLEMMDKWQQLGEQYDDSKKVLIGVLDCAGLQKLCTAHNVTSHPHVVLYGKGQLEGTAFFGTPDSLLIELSDLQDAAKALVAECDARALDTCSKTQRAELAPFFEMAPETLMKKLRLLQAEFNESKHTEAALYKEYGRIHNDSDEEKSARIKQPHDSKNFNMIAKRFELSGAQTALKRLIANKYETLRRLTAVFAARGGEAALAPDELTKVYASLSTNLAKKRKKAKKTDEFAHLREAALKFKGPTSPAPPRDEL